MNHVIIDFETFNEEPISGGASKYSLTAEILCLAYQINDGPVQLWKPEDEPPQDLFDAIANGYMIFAHNANFEQCIWRNVCVAKLGWPEVPHKQWYCTAAESLAMNLPAALEKVALALKLSVEKDMEGRRLMLKLSKPRKPSKNDPSTRHSKPEEYERLYSYCVQDVVTEAAVHAVVPRLSKREQGVYWFDQEVNRRGVKVDRKLVEAAIIIWDKYCSILNAELAEITEGYITSADQTKRITEWMPKIGAGQVFDLTKHSVSTNLKSELPTTAKRILEIRKELAMSSISKFPKMLECAEPDDRIRGCFQYHGAGQTGRWAGRLVQLQNLPRGIVDPEMVEELISIVLSLNVDAFAAKAKELKTTFGELLSSLIRSTIIPDDGNKFIVCDFAAVEARGLAWVAGEEWLLQAFKDKRDVYCEMGADIYRRSITKADKIERHVSKSAVLGCGYSMGATAFQAYLEMSGIKADSEFCQMVIDAYRKKNRKIVSLWYSLDRAAVKCVQTGKPVKVRNLVFHRKGEWLALRLPSGRDIHYYKPHIVQGNFGPQVAFWAYANNALKRMYLYGGLICENAIQGLCRDLLVEAMARLEKSGYRVVAHVHDEVICEVDKNFGSVSEMESIMSEVPSWAEGFPVGAEGWEGTRYRK